MVIPFSHAYSNHPYTEGNFSKKKLFNGASSPMAYIFCKNDLKTSVTKCSIRNGSSLEDHPAVFLNKNKKKTKTFEMII